MTEREAVRHAWSEPHVVEPMHRRWLAAVCALGLLAVLVIGLVSLPVETAPLPDIARQSIEIALPRWKFTEAVNEIVYGTRGFDTFGETFLLIAAVVSVCTLARSRERRREYVGEESAGEHEQRESDPVGVEDSPEESQARQAEEHEADGEEGPEGEEESVGDEHPESRGAVEDGDDVSDRTPLGATAPERSESMTVVIRVSGRIAAVVLSVTAVYLFARGYTPGGGFPAGAAVSGVILLLYTALGYRRVSRVARTSVLEPIELIGAVVLVGVAVTGLAIHGSLLSNWFPLGQVETIASGGLLQVFSTIEFVEVGAGLTIVFAALLTMKHDWTPDLVDSEIRQRDRDRERDRERDFAGRVRNSRDRAADSRTAAGDSESGRA